MALTKISYSSLCDWQHCPLYFKLSHIDRLRPRISSPWFAYGTLIHRYTQNILNEKIEPEAGAKKFVKIWSRFCSMFKKEIAAQLKKGVDPLKLNIPAEKILLTIRNKFKEEFGNYKILAIEERLELPNGSKWPQNFKGFIDVVLEREDGMIIIIDFKSCNTAFMFNKFKDKYKDYQLTLYKHYYATKHGVDPKNILTYFVLLEKNHKSKEPIVFSKVTSGPRKVENALKWLHGALGAINKNLWLKKKTSCRKYGEDNLCVFFNTEHCR